MRGQTAATLARVADQTNYAVSVNATIAENVTNNLRSETIVRVDINYLASGSVTARHYILIPAVTAATPTPYQPKTPSVLQAAVAGGSGTVGVATITLPATYAEWTTLVLGVWDNSNDQALITKSIPTAALAAQTANMRVLIGGNPSTNNAVELNFNPTARTLASRKTGAERIIYAVLR